MKKYIAIGVALWALSFLAVNEVRAQTPTPTPVKVTWVNPTQYTDNSALPAAELTATRVAWGSCNGSAFGTKIGEHKLGAVTTDTITGLAAGKYCFMVFATATKSGQAPTESDGTNVVSVTLALGPTPTPKPPSTVSVACTAAGSVWICTIE